MNSSFCVSLLGGYLLSMSHVVFAAPPTWWSTGNPPVIDLTAPENNFAPANIGQAKWMAKNALEALRAAAPAIATAVENDLVGVGKPIANWNPPATPAEVNAQHSPLVIGQLKAISAPFYDHLNAANAPWLLTERTANGTLNSGTHYPWSLTTTDDANKAVANIGQLKAVFSLRFEMLPPALDEGYAPWAEGYFGTGHLFSPSNDPDGDGLTNAQEYLVGTSPIDIDTDHDGMPDGEDWDPTTPFISSNPVALTVVVMTPLK